MNQSKLYEWLLEHDCPYDFTTSDYADEAGGTCTLIFTEKEEE